MRSPLLSTIAMMGLVACGQQPRGTKIEYYVEENSASDSQDDSGDSGINDEDAKVDPKALQLILAEPTVGASEDQLVVTVSVQNPVKDATWTLFFSASQDLSQPTAIASDLPITQTQITWDTSAMAAGSYYIYAEVVADGKNLVFKNTKPVVIEEDQVPGVNGKPTLALQFPLGENVFVVGTPQNIRWEASDPDNDPVSYKLEYSANGGTTWTMIADNVTEKTYSWPATGLTQGITYKIRVTASDDKGATAVAASPRNFGVALTPMTFAAGFGAMMTARCGNCHATGRPNQAQFRSNNYALATIGVAAKQMNIKTRIENNTMPPAGALGPADKEILTMWLWDGAK
jgi:hypothetical protein